MLARKKSKRYGALLMRHLQRRPKTRELLPGCSVPAALVPYARAALAARGWFARAAAGSEQEDEGEDDPEQTTEMT
jgi:hypothetical protein